MCEEPPNSFYFFLYFQHWDVFTNVTEVFILVPALLGLKGNLEMTLASRLSTAGKHRVTKRSPALSNPMFTLVTGIVGRWRAVCVTALQRPNSDAAAIRIVVGIAAASLSVTANIGQMETAKEKWAMIVGNMALIQVQATVVGFLASIAAVIFGWIPDGHFLMEHAVLLCASSVSTAFIASLILGLVMIGVIIGSKKLGINPDNVATPIAASLGDLVTLALLSGISWGLYKEMMAGVILRKRWSHQLTPVTGEVNVFVNLIVCLLFIALLPVWFIVARKNPATRQVLATGWEPVIIAMAISSVGGLILDKTVSDPNFAGIAVFTPVINGVGGNLVAVQASRISTYLHMMGSPGDDIGLVPRKCHSPCRTFFSSDVNSRSARVLFLLVVPGHLVFLYTINSMKGGHTTMTLIFMVFYMMAALLQVLVLLYIADWMVHWMWGRGMDPDNFSIPYLTALGDLLGTGLLALSFHVLWLIGDRDTDVGD
ncbi:unnamed protein product [Ranitomeya imitator]|uniref:Solute carrier family 41 member n=1 Tax=Ranitomeya imitator TaxID=111125 RepID=A0ABN9M1I9_9NEOB|nr:unnamed protein product [Ranitomeya imitator]